jgi:hypothetical protein
VFDSKNYNYGPYTIDYVANRHQNDYQNPLYNKNCLNPLFYVSLNPVVMPAASSILPQTNNGESAITEFRHQKLSMNTINAQEKMQKLQGKYGLWYANGYRVGAGLHEECLANSSELAARIASRPQVEQVHYATSVANSKQYAPDYIVNAHKDGLTCTWAKRKISKGTRSKNASEKMSKTNTRKGKISKFRTLTKKNVKNKYPKGK